MPSLEKIYCQLISKCSVLTKLHAWLSLLKKYQDLLILFYVCALPVCIYTYHVHGVLSNVRRGCFIPLKLD